MRGLGSLCVLLGIGSFILPYFDRQFVLFEPLDPWQPWSGIGVVVAGILLHVLAAKRKAGAKAQDPA
jgi:hypothetical protein